MQTKNRDSIVKLEYYRNWFLTLHLGKGFGLLSLSLSSPASILLKFKKALKNQPLMLKCHL